MVIHAYLVLVGRNCTPLRVTFSEVTMCGGTIFPLADLTNLVSLAFSLGCDLVVLALREERLCFGFADISFYLKRLNCITRAYFILYPLPLTVSIWIWASPRVDNLRRSRDMN